MLALILFAVTWHPWVLYFYCDPGPDFASCETINQHSSDLHRGFESREAAERWMENHPLYTPSSLRHNDNEWVGCAFKYWDVDESGTPITQRKTVHCDTQENLRQDFCNEECIETGSQEDSL